MNKNSWYKMMYIISGLLIAIYIIVLVRDYINYNPMITSAPFYTYVIIRSLEFLLPSIILFIIGIVFKKKIKKN